MLFDAPITFDEAVAQSRSRDLLPTNLSSEQIREWLRQLRATSLFSARNNNEEALQEIGSVLDQLLQGQIGVAKGREIVQQSMDLLGYDPEAGGFPDLEDPNIPPAVRGSLRDLASTMRVDLVLKTQMRQMWSIGQKVRGSTPQALYTFPCWELVRIYPREVPRGEKRAHGAIVPDPENAWPARWQKAGGELHAGRMVARKDDPIWAALGDSAEFPDALDTDVPPFAFGSGMGWREVDRDEATKLGVILDGAIITPGEIPRLDKAQVKASKFDPEYLREMEAFGAEVEAGKLRIQQELEAAGRPGFRDLRTNVRALVDATPSSRSLSKKRGGGAASTVRANVRALVKGLATP